MNIQEVLRFKVPFCITLCVLLMSFPLYSHADFSAGIKDYNEKHYEEAMAEFKRSAVLGHKLSQFNIGIMYLRGEGTKQDLVESYAWLAVAASDKNPDRIQARDAVMSKMDEPQKNAAIDRMQQLFSEIKKEAEKLEPVIISEEQCKFHLKQVKRYTPQYPASMLNEGKQDSTDAEFTIDKFGFPRDYSLSVSLSKEFDTVIYDALKQWRYEPIIINGKPAEVAVAQVRFRFRIDGGQLDKKAVEKYTNELREKAKQGNPNDMYALAYLGDLVPELSVKKSESNQWYYQAAQAGYSKAQYEIGKSLFRGEGCEQDTHKGLYWLTMAAEERSTDAQYFLGISLLGSDKIQEDRPLAIEWLQKAASAKHEKAMMRLAWILATDKDEHVYDPVKSLALVNEVYKNYADKLRSNETLAAAQAANGLFNDAVKSQQTAIKEAKHIDYPLDDLQARLESYKNNQSWRE